MPKSFWTTDGTKKMKRSHSTDFEIVECVDQELSTPTKLVLKFSVLARARDKKYCLFTGRTQEEARAWVQKNFE